MFYLVSISIALQLTSAKTSKRAREQRAHRHTLTSVDNKPGLGDREGLGPKYVTTSTSSRAYFYTARTCPNLQDSKPCSKPKPRTRRPLVLASLCSGGRLVACMSPIPWRLCLNGLGIAHPIQNRAPADATRALSAHAELCGSGKHASSSHGVCRGGRTTRSGGLLPT